MPDQQLTLEQMVYAQLGGNALVRREGDRIIAIEAVRKDVTQAEHQRARDSKSPLEAYSKYKQRVELVEQYLQSSLEARELLVDEPIGLAVTPLRTLVMTPKRLDVKDTDAIGEVTRRALPPFEWFNKHVNQGVPECLGGSQELSTSLLRRLRISGKVGWWIAFATRLIAGVQWRVPVEVMTYSGHQIGKDDDGYFVTHKVGGKDEKRYLRNEPDKGIYAGMCSIINDVGDGKREGVPPLFGIVNTCLALEMLSTGDLAAMAQNERSIGVWQFNTEAIEKANLALFDSENSEGETVEGVMNIVMGEREARRSQNAQGRIEIAMPDFVKYEEIHPDLQMLEKLDRYLIHEKRLKIAAGFRFDPDGRVIEVQTEQAMAVKFHELRDKFLEPWYQLNIYDTIIAENVRYFPKLNKIAWHPYQFVAPGFASRGKTRSKTEKGLQQKAEQRIKDLLDGWVEPLEVRCRMAAAPARRDSRLREIANFVRQGVLSPEYGVDSVGGDFDLEVSRFMRHHMMTVEVNPDEIPVFSPTLSNRQMSQSGGKTTTTANPQSAGRPLGATDGVGVERGAEE